jgi:hypothetical protein
MVCFLLFVGGELNLPAIIGDKALCTEWVKDLQELAGEEQPDVSQFFLDQDAMFDEPMVVYFYQPVMTGDMKKCAGIHVDYKCSHFFTIICPPPDPAI